jgi:hypothetical protein
MKTIVLFTHSYPYSISLEDSFVEPELEVLSKYFKVIIVPLSKKGTKSGFVNKLENVEIFDNFQDFNSKKNIFKIFNINGLL